MNPATCNVYGPPRYHAFLVDPETGGTFQNVTPPEGTSKGTALRMARKAKREGGYAGRVIRLVYTGRGVVAALRTLKGAPTI